MTCEPLQSTQTFHVGDFLGLEMTVRLNGVPTFIPGIEYRSSLMNSFEEVVGSFTITPSTTEGVYALVYGVIDLPPDQYRADIKLLYNGTPFHTQAFYIPIMESVTA